MKKKNQLQDLIDYHVKAAASAKSSCEQIDHILHPYTSDALYEAHEEHKRFVKILKGILIKIKKDESFVTKRKRIQKT